MMENDRKRVRVSGDVDSTVGTVVVVVVVVVVASAVERSLCRAREWTAGGGATRATERMIERSEEEERERAEAHHRFILRSHSSTFPLCRFGALAVSCQSHPLLRRSRSIHLCLSLAHASPTPQPRHGAPRWVRCATSGLVERLSISISISRGFYYFFRRASLAEREVSIAPGPSCERVARCAALRRARHSQRLLL